MTKFVSIGNDCVALCGSYLYPHELIPMLDQRGKEARAFRKNLPIIWKSWAISFGLTAKEELENRYLAINSLFAAVLAHSWKYAKSLFPSTRNSPVFSASGLVAYNEINRWILGKLVTYSEASPKSGKPTIRLSLMTHLHFDVVYRGLDRVLHEGLEKHMSKLTIELFRPLREIFRRMKWSFNDESCLNWSAANTPVADYISNKLIK